MRATDLAGNVDLTPASRTWTREQVPDNTFAGTGVQPFELTLPIAGGGSATLTFTDVLTSGLTTVTPLTGAPELAPGYIATNAVYFDLTTTATFAGDVTVCLPFDPGSLHEPRLLHLDGSEWAEITIIDRPGEWRRLWPHRQPLSLRDREGDPRA